MLPPIRRMSQLSKQLAAQRRTLQSAAAATARMQRAIERLTREMAARTLKADRSTTLAVKPRRAEPKDGQRSRREPPRQPIPDPERHWGNLF